MLDLSVAGLGQFLSILIVIFIALALAGLVITFSHLFTKHFLIKWIDKLFDKKHSGLGKVMFKNRVFHRIAYLIPAMFLYHYAYLFDIEYAEYKVYLAAMVRLLTGLYLIVASVLVLFSILNCIDDRYKRLAIAKQRPIKSYLQVVKIIIFILAAVISVSILSEKSLGYVFASVGAATAVLLLVFKDSILGFVASIQLAAYDMVRIGDWIEMPNFGADGEVVDISLNTVKVQNFDKTIVTIPSYALLTSGLKNWRGMQEAGGRRIKRSINIDITSIKICDPKLLDDLSNLDELKKEKLTNKMKITNIGVFRIYLERYLQHHPGVHKEMKILIRQMQGTATGLPLELYFFTNEIDSQKYEMIQADIFDHLYAVLSIFDLRVFQYATNTEED